MNYWLGSTALHTHFRDRCPALSSLLPRKQPSQCHRQGWAAIVELSRALQLTGLWFPLTLSVESLPLLFIIFCLCVCVCVNTWMSVLGYTPYPQISTLEHHSNYYNGIILMASQFYRSTVFYNDIHQKERFNPILCSFLNVKNKKIT